MLSPAEAARLILEHVRPLETIRLPLREALDLVLAEDVASPIDLPGWDNSAMDGYAVRSADVAGASSERPVALRVIETVPAGRFRGGKRMRTPSPYPPHGMLRRAGGIPLALGVARDTKDSLREHLSGGGARDADLLVTSAGVSVGEHDLVRDVLTALGCDMKLWRIRMRPGAPLGFGLLDGRPWIGLPGNPVSTMVTFELFVRPIIRRLLGHALPFRRTVAVCVAEPITLGPKLRHYLRAIVSSTDG